MKEDNKNNRQPNEGHDINSKAGIPKRGTVHTKGGHEGDLSGQMGGSQMSNRDVDAGYGKETGSLNPTSPLKFNQSDKANTPPHNVRGVADDDVPETSGRADSPEKNPYGNKIADKRLGNNINTKKSDSGPSHT